MLRSSRRAIVGSLALTAVLAACGSSKTASPSTSSTTAASTSTGGTPTTVAAGPNPNAKEQLPPGDIPDNQVYVLYTPSTGGYSLKYPQGWAKRVSTGGTTFVQNFNSITVSTTKSASAPSVTSARATAAAQLSSLPGFHLGTVDTVTRPAGRVVRLVYNATSATDAVTGKSVTLDVERYLFWHKGTLVTLTLSSAKGSDNVDPWKTVTDSLTWK
ncbi:MAG TPA: hypothetical protein VGP92_03475 [Acidimicrobiia bacterium]|nr:hypothetical protein [Acidimicrobiia bacterium]